MIDYISYKYSLPYVVYLCFLFFLLFGEFLQINRKEGTKIIRQLTIISFLVFWGFRGFVGRDIFNYFEFFQKLPTIWNWNVTAFSELNFDLGFKAYALIIKSINSSFSFFIFVNALIDVILLNSIAKRYSRYYVFFFIVYVVFYGYVFEMEQIRNAKSVLLFLLSLKYVENKKPFPYLFLNLIGISFHFSAWIYLPLYFILDKKIPAIVSIAVFIVGNMLVLFGIKYIGPLFSFIVAHMPAGEVQERLAGYLLNTIYASSWGLSIGYIERVVTYILLFFVFRNKLQNSAKSNVIFMNLYFLYFICYFFFSEMNIAAIRLSALFVTSYAVLIPNMYGVLASKKEKAIVLSLLFVYMNVKFAAGYKWVEYKYENIIWNETNYKERKDILHKANEYRKMLELKSLKRD